MERAAASPVTRAILIVGLITALGGAARFWQLDRPAEKVFDEVYYATDGCLYAGVPFRECGLERSVERSWVHPPLGKYLIAWGVDGLGNRPLGWRVSAAAAGTATIALVGALAFLLTRRPALAGVAAAFIATEHLAFVQSRVAMLDIFLTMFVVLGFLVLVWDRVRRDRLDESDAADGRSPTPLVAGGAGTTLEPGPAPARVLPRPPTPVGSSGVRPLRIAAGGALGAATAVKWSGIYALIGAAVLALAWERTRRKRAGYQRPLRGAIAEEWASLSLAFALAPATVYALTWLPWLADHGLSLTAWWSNHLSIADYHLGLNTLTGDGDPIHPYMSRAWSWFLLRRPVAYFYEADGDSAAEILAIGNPFLFWGALLFVPYLALIWRTRSDWRAGAVLVPILIQYVPWLFVSRPLFLFYLTPVTPFLALGATLVLGDVAEAGGRRSRLVSGAAGVAVAASVALFAFFWPVLVGDPMSMAAWRDRMWFPSWI